MKILVLLAVLSIIPSETDPKSRMAGVVAVTPKGELTLDRQEKVSLAGVAISNPSAVNQFLKQFLLNEVVKVDWEPGRVGSAHVFVPIECKEIAALLKEPAPVGDEGCVRSVYVNELLLRKRWAKPAPAGVTLYREKLYTQPRTQPKNKR